MQNVLLFAAPNSYVLRNWLTSGLIDLCAQELNLTPVLVSPFVAPEFSTDEGATYRNIPFPNEKQRNLSLPANYPSTLYYMRYARMRVYSLEVPNGGGQTRRFADMRDPIHYAAAFASRLLPRQSGGRAQARRLLGRMMPAHRLVSRIMAETQPKALVVGTPGIHFLDELLSIGARRARIPIACVVNSWDNLTSRGPMLVRPDLLMVWNEQMREYAINLHHFPERAVKVVGSLQFSQYERPIQNEIRAALYREMGLPLDTPYVLYLTGAHAPEYEAEDLAALVRVLENSELAGLPVVARIHPEARAEPFQRIRHELLKIHVPPRFSAEGASGFNFDREQAQIMAAQLQGAKLVVASCGTTALLEAALFDRPIVQLRWMGALSRSRDDQVKLVENIQSYKHIQALDAAECRSFSDSPADLPAIVSVLMHQPNHTPAAESTALGRLVPRPLADAPRNVIHWLRLLLNR